jgi:hypothetical protein
VHNGLQDSRRVSLLIEILDDLAGLPPTGCGDVLRIGTFFRAVAQPAR